MKTLVFFIVLLITIETKSQLLDSSNRFSKRIILVDAQNDTLNPAQKFGTFFFIIPAGFLMINEHEIGHTIFARLTGDPQAHYYLTKNGSLGLNEYDVNKLSTFGKTAVPLAGVLFSQGLAQLSDMALRKIQMPRVLQQFTAAVFLVSKVDFAFQSIQGFRPLRWDRLTVKGKSGIDMQDFAFNLSGGRKGGTRAVLVGTLLVSALDIYLSRHQISRNWQIFRGKKMYKKLPAL
jgi:hypothetical protein